MRGPWFAVVNDLIGGWCVSTLNKPLSEHDHRADGVRVEENAGYVIADCYCVEDAARIARLLNEEED